MSFDNVRNGNCWIGCSSCVQTGFIHRVNNSQLPVHDWGTMRTGGRPSWLFPKSLQHGFLSENSVGSNLIVNHDISYIHDFHRFSKVKVQFGRVRIFRYAQIVTVSSQAGNAAMIPETGELFVLI